MGIASTIPRPRRRRLRALIPVALVVGVSGLLATGLASAVREARRAAQAATTT
jgi:hypothetical protein